MIVKPENFEWDFEKREKVRSEYEECVADGGISRADADYLLEDEHFAPLFEKAPELCFFCAERMEPNS